MHNAIFFKYSTNWKWKAMFISSELIYCHVDEQCHWQFADVGRCVSVGLASRQQIELVGAALSAGRRTRRARADRRVRRSDGERRGVHRAGRVRGDREPAATSRQRAGAVARHASSGYSYTCAAPHQRLTAFCGIGTERQHTRNGRSVSLQFSLTSGL